MWHLIGLVCVCVYVCVCVSVCVHKCLYVVCGILFGYFGYDLRLWVENTVAYHRQNNSTFKSYFLATLF